MDGHLIQFSKFLSRVLRHHPEAIGLTLDPQGWAEIEQLLTQARCHGSRSPRNYCRRSSSRTTSNASRSTRRGRVSGPAKAIRSRLTSGWTPTQPPDLLYHGTAARFIAAIKERGLLPGRRNHVHLSGDKATAARVGGRHGSPVVLAVQAGLMHAAGYPFYLSANGVWLTEHVPAQYLDFPIDPERTHAAIHANPT